MILNNCRCWGQLGVSLTSLEPAEAIQLIRRILGLSSPSLGSLRDLFRCIVGSPQGGAPSPGLRYRSVLR